MTAQTAPILLECGHYADTRERLRQGDESFCPVCKQWVLRVKR